MIEDGTRGGSKLPVMELSGEDRELRASASGLSPKGTIFFKWLLRILGGCVAAVALVSAGLVAYFFCVVEPRQRAAEQKTKQAAEAFGRLEGMGRRLAIYDAFAAQISAHYYDQSFAGFDWPKLRQYWRIRAARSPDDWHLYWDVMAQLAQRFPASHVAVEMPTAAATRVRANKGTAIASLVSAPCPEPDGGMLLTPIRRGKSVVMEVGEVIPGSAAAYAGVAPGWPVLEYANKPAPPGRRITATLLRLTPDQIGKWEGNGGDSLRTLAFPDGPKSEVSFDVDCTRARSAVEVRSFAGGVRYIRFDKFEEEPIRKVADALRQAGPAGVVIDLRFNSGGFPMLLLNLLLPPGRPAYRTMDASGLGLVRTDGGAAPYSGPLAILSGPASASAAEVSTAVLKQLGRAIVVGRRTNGSVLGAVTYPLPDGGRVQVPVQDIIMLDGTRLEGAGVAPDLAVLPFSADIRSGRDTALFEALRALKRSAGPEIPNRVSIRR